MICTCTTEGRFGAETARVAMAKRLGVEASALAAAVWRSLHDDFKATVTVGADQWFGVWVKVDAGDSKIPIHDLPVTYTTKEGDTVTVPSVDFSMECDHPLDGMIFIWNKLAETYPERAPGNAARVDDLVRLAHQLLLIELSERHLRDAEEAETAYSNHKAECTSTCKEWPPCAVGKPLVETYWEACRVLMAKWGEPSPDDAKAFWGTEEDEVSEDPLAKVL
jgi:hypothetical protein